MKKVACSLNGLFQKKSKQDGSVEDMEFPGGIEEIVSGISRV